MTSTLVCALFGIVSSVALIAEDALSANQNWTLLGILAVTLGGVAKLLHWMGNRFVTSIDKQTDKFGAALEKHSEAVVGNTTEIGKLVTSLTQMSVQQNRIDAETQDAVDDIKGAVGAVPARVVEELQRRKLHQ